MLLGVDIGGSKIALGVGDHAGRLHARRRLAAPGAPEEALEAVVAACRDALRETGVGRPEAVGVAAPGPLDRATGRILGPPNLAGWDDVPVVSRLAEAFGAPVFLENDANANALAERRFGAARGADRVVALTMSTGVGAGLVLDGRLYRGRGDFAGEIGHAPVVWEGRACACGMRGCLEAYVGGRAWTAHLRAHTPETSRVCALAGSREAVAPEHVIAAAGEGDAFACAELDAFNAMLGRGLVAAAFAFAPDVIVLGTIVAAAGERCLAPLRRIVREHTWPGLHRDLRIEAAALWPDRTSLAGVCVALEGLGR